MFPLPACFGFDSMSSEKSTTHERETKPIEQLELGFRFPTPK